MTWTDRAGARWGMLATALLWACAGDARIDAGTASRDGGGPPEDASTANGTDAGDDAAPRFPIVTDPRDPAAYIYDDSALRTYELRLAPSALAKIDADPMAEAYVEGTLRFEGEEYGPVGIRYKGSVGAFRGCTASARGGAKTCTKLSMKVSFNWKDPEARFFGLKKLQFHAMNRDPSMLKDRLGYALFRQFGIAAPRAVHARLLINGDFVGLFALVEQVDGRFTRSRFEEGGKGNLYKEAWPVDAQGAPTRQALLRQSLRTNEDEMPTFEGMTGLGAALAGATEGTLSDAMANYMDVDYSMRYVAVDRAIAHDDGPFHWYCFGATCFNHNFYMYEEADTERLWMIAWDLDISFNLDNVVTTLWFDWDDTTLGCQAQALPPFVYPQRPSVCDRLIRGWAHMQSRYLAETAAFVEGPFEASRVEAQLSRWETQIEPVVTEASKAHEDAISVREWRQATAALREAIATLRERAQARVAQGPVEIRDPWTRDPRDPRDPWTPTVDASVPDDPPVRHDAGMDGGMPPTKADAGLPNGDAAIPPDDDDDAGVE